MRQMRIRYSDCFSVEPSGGMAIVRFEAPTVLGTHSIEILTCDLFALIDHQGMADLVLDLTGVRHLSSQALGMLVNLQRKTTASGGKLVLAGVGENLARMFRITHLDSLLTLQEQTSQAAEIMYAPGCCHMTGMPLRKSRYPNDQPAPAHS